MVQIKNVFFVIMSIALIGFQSMYAMNNKKNQQADVRSYVEPKLDELTKNLDNNLKALLNFFWYESSEVKYKNIYTAIDTELNKLVDFMKEDAFDWYSDLVKNICNEIKKQLIFSQNSSQSQRQAQIITAWRMKNYLFELFDQKRVKIYFDLDCIFKPLEEVHENRSLDEIIQEYNHYNIQEYNYYKLKLAGIDRIDNFFKELDDKINTFKKDKKLFEDEIEYIKKSTQFNSTFSDIRWGIYNYVLPAISLGMFAFDFDKEYANIKKQDIERQVTYLNNQIPDLEKELKNQLANGLHELKNAIKSFKPLFDETMWPHKTFLNNMIELASKECKYSTLSDFVSNYNPKKKIQHFIRSKLAELKNPLKNAQNYLGQDSIEKSIDERVNGLINTLLDVNTVDNLKRKMGESLFDFVMGVVEKILNSDDFRTTLCDKAEYYFPDHNIKEFICELHTAKKQCKDLNLLLVEALQLTGMIGSDRLGILLKTVLRMVANDSETSKEFLGKTLYGVVKIFKDSFQYLEEKNQSLCDNLLWNAKTKDDDIHFLSYLANANKQIINKNAKDSLVVRRLLHNETKKDIIKKSFNAKAKVTSALHIAALLTKKDKRTKQMFSEYSKNDILESYKRTEKHLTDILESYKRTEKHLMVRMLEESNWKKKRNLETELFNIRKGMNKSSSNNLINITTTRYNELMMLQKKD